MEPHDELSIEKNRNMDFFWHSFTHTKPYDPNDVRVAVNVIIMYNYQRI